ncbi:MAG: hypothetical protein DA408_01470 [Bacteroidetes bacterium]|nr:MAG: hypothetical protein C7N36_01415 [Bacteroidota bacterium]PTM14988.1 MAG: hypothetical protein DA408_01470 [Bacteroidota bacterium]
MIKHRIFFLALVCCLAGSGLMAQHGPQHPRFPAMTEELKTALQLSPEQVAQLEQLQQETQTAMVALREQDNLDQEAKRAQMHALHQRSKTQMETILSPEQQQQLHSFGEAKRQEHRTQQKSMRKELQQYRQENIQPVMRAQRQKLDAVMRAEDQALLAKTRATLAAARAEHQAQRQEARKAKASQEPRQPGTHRKGPHQGNRQAMWAKYPAEKEALQTLAAKYDRDITALLEAIAPQREQWQADQKAIRDRYRPADAPQRPERAEQGQRGDRHNPERRAQDAKIRFLLMDPTAPEETAQKPAATTLAATAYPNPATTTTTLSFELSAAASVRIDLRNENGNVVKTISRDNFNAGKNQLTVDLSEVQNGTYYLTLHSRALADRQSVKVVVVK